jgi:hypothetical protein
MLTAPGQLAFELLFFNRVAVSADRCDQDTPARVARAYLPRSLKAASPESELEHGGLFG